jgi:hypothetical protein
MKDSPAPFTKILFVGAFVGWVVVCLAFPDAVLWGIEMLGTMLLWLVFIGAAFWWVFAGLAHASSGKKPPSSPATRAVSPPPAAKQCDTLTPFLLGLIIGHWFGSGPDDGGHCS